MSRSSKNKKNKVPKITEEEYAAYLSTLKAPETQTVEKQSEQCVQNAQIKTE